MFGWYSIATMIRCLADTVSQQWYDVWLIQYRNHDTMFGWYSITTMIRCLADTVSQQWYDVWVHVDVKGTHQEGKMRAVSRVMNNFRSSLGGVITERRTLKWFSSLSPAFHGGTEEPGDRFHFSGFRSKCLSRNNNIEILFAEMICF